MSYILQDGFHCALIYWSKVMIDALVLCKCITSKFKLLTIYVMTWVIDDRADGV